MADAYELLGNRRVLTFPRVVGALALLWGLAVGAEGFVTGEPLWLLVATTWTAAAWFLIRLSLVRLAGPVVLALIGLEFSVRAAQFTGLELLAWLAVITAVTEDRPTDRALLIRTCLTVVYAFAALSKLNPSWLAGDGISGLITRYDHLESFRFIAESPTLTIAIAIAVICLEAWMAIGLWFKGTRLITAVIGGIMHLGFIAAASTNVWAVVHLTVFNLGVVACYPAFWAELTPGRGAARPLTRLAEI